MNLLSAKEAADKLGVDSSRIRQFILEGRLPAQKIGNSYAINEDDLALVADRKAGRPKKAEEEGETKPIIDTEPPESFRPLTHKERLQAEIQAHQDALAFEPSVEAETKVGDVVKTWASVTARTKARKAKLGTAAKSMPKTTAVGKSAAMGETKPTKKRTHKKRAGK